MAHRPADSARDNGFMTRDEIILASERYLFPAVAHYFKERLVISRARDQYVWDADGRQYLDFFGGIATISVGHLNDKVRARVHEQADTLHHVSTLYATEPQAALAETRGFADARRRADPVVLHQ